MNGEQSGDLLDPDRNYYVLKEKLWDWGGGDIYDERGQTIGKMKRKILSLRSEITISEPNGSPELTVNKKIVSLRRSYEIKDHQGNLLGITKKKILSIIRPKMWMENANGEETLIGQGSFAGWNFDIMNRQGKKVAEVSKIDRWRDVIAGGIFDFSDTYAIHILDPTYDRRTLLGFVVAIDNSVHDK